MSSGLQSLRLMATLILLMLKKTDVELVNEDGEKYNIITENLRDAVNVSIYHRYVHTPIAQNADTLKEAIS